MIEHRPERGSDVEAFIKSERDRYEHPSQFQRAVWHALDDLLDLYRLHADTGTPLTEVAETPGPPE